MHFVFIYPPSLNIWKKSRTRPNRQQCPRLPMFFLRLGLLWKYVTGDAGNDTGLAPLKAKHLPRHSPRRTRIFTGVCPSILNGLIDQGKFYGPRIESKYFVYSGLCNIWSIGFRPEILRVVLVRKICDWMRKVRNMKRNGIERMRTSVSTSFRRNAYDEFADCHVHEWKPYKNTAPTDNPVQKHYLNADNKKNR